ncbi:hypothetical protein ACOMHN_008482 [Nucella lapillus]
MMTERSGKVPAYYGFLYIRGGNNKARFIYDSNGNLAGIQTAIPGNMQGFNSHNETIKVPARGVIPPILLSDDRDSFGVQMYTITAHTRAIYQDICSETSHSGACVEMRIVKRAVDKYE